MKSRLLEVRRERDDAGGPALHGGLRRHPRLDRDRAARRARVDDLRGRADRLGDRVAGDDQRAARQRRQGGVGDHQVHGRVDSRRVVRDPAAGLIEVVQGHQALGDAPVVHRIRIDGPAGVELHGPCRPRGVRGAAAAVEVGEHAGAGLGVTVGGAAHRRRVAAVQRDRRVRVRLDLWQRRPLLRVEVALRIGPVRPDVVIAVRLQLEGEGLGPHVVVVADEAVEVLVLDVVVERAVVAGREVRRHEQVVGHQHVDGVGTDPEETAVIVGGDARVVHDADVDARAVLRFAPALDGDVGVAVREDDVVADGHVLGAVLDLQGRRLGLFALVDEVLLHDGPLEPVCGLAADMVGPHGQAPVVERVAHDVGVLAAHAPDAGASARCGARCRR